MPVEQPSVQLNSGYAMPQLGFGVFKVPPDDAERVVTKALEAGYRSIDTAAMYGNEEGVGRAIAAAGLAREDFFVTTKLNNPEHRAGQVERAFDRSLANLDLAYLDLYLIHWPLPSTNRYVEVWRAMEKLSGDGRVRSIGVSNFQPAHLSRLVEETSIVPALNQIELHPYLTQERLRSFHREHGIATEAWSPLARGGRLLRQPEVVSTADKYGVTPAQAVIRWHLQLGNVVIPKSATPARIEENFNVFNFELDADDVAVLSGLNRDERTGPDPDHFG